jgi:hypothetical protein
MKICEFQQESIPTMSDRHYVHQEDEVALAKILKESKPWLEQYGTTIIYGVAAVLAVSAVVVYVARRPPATAAESSGLLMASSVEDYQTVADSSPDSPIGIVARLRQAELSLDEAAGQLFTDREKGVKTLDNAARTFENLADRKDLNSVLRERVLAGVARVLECRCDGTDATVKPAIEAWEKLLKEYPDSKMFKDIAESRVKTLKSDNSKAFYAWFHTQNPKASDDLLLPQDGPGKVPDVPKIDIPDFTTPAAPAEGAKTEGAKTETPAAPAEGTPTAEEKPAPAEGTPAPEAKPTPAEGTPAPAEAAPAPAEATPAPEAKPAPAEGTPAPAEGSPAAEKSGE